MTKPKTLAEILKKCHFDEHGDFENGCELTIKEALQAINDYIKWVIGEDETDTRWDGNWRNGYKSRGVEARKRAGLN